MGAFNATLPPPIDDRLYSLKKLGSKRLVGVTTAHSQQPHAQTTRNGVRSGLIIGVRHYYLCFMSPEVPGLRPGRLPRYLKNCRIRRPLRAYTKDPWRIPTDRARAAGLGSVKL